MQYSVKGITFSKDDLSTIRLDDLKVNSVSPAHLFTFMRSQPFLLLRAGDYVEAEFVEKYKSRGAQSLRCLTVADPDDVAAFRSLFQKIKNSRSQNERLELKDEIIKLFADHYWRQSDRSFLSFVAACFDEFYALPLSVVQNLQATSMILYSRALLTSSISIAHCLAQGLVEFPFLKDMYNVSFIMDYGFVEQGEFNYLLVQACERERNHPGTGLAYLETHPKAKNEGSIFFRHPSLSADFAQKNKDSFHYPEVIEHIRYHHEKSDGSGFPSGHAYSGLAESETILMFGDYMTPFGEHIFQAGDGVKIIKEAFAGLKNLEDKHLLPINRGVETWESLMDWTNEEIAVAEPADEANDFESEAS